MSQNNSPTPSPSSSSQSEVLGGFTTESKDGSTTVEKLWGEMLPAIAAATNIPVRLLDHAGAIAAEKGGIDKQA